MMNISIIIPTTTRWPRIQRTLDIVLPQTKECGGEVYFIVNSNDCLPPGGVESLPHWYEDAHLIVVPDGDAFTLRAAGYAQCTGEIIGILEDHNSVDNDWCKRHIEIHQKKPEINAVVSAIINGTAETVLEKANFLLGFSAYLPDGNPMDNNRIPMIAGSTIKRSAIKQLPPKPGYVELITFWEIYSSGSSYFDRTTILTHYQRHPLFETISHHFNNGKSNAGYFRRFYDAKNWILKFISSVLMPVTTLFHFIAGRHRHIMKQNKNVYSLPYLLVLSVTNAVGCIFGLIFGAGRSAHYID